jgi:type IV pilus assembly protein PilC
MAYSYKVRDPLGNVHEGHLEAASADEATQQLRRDGFTVLAVDGDGDDGPGLFPRRVTKSEIIYATSQLAIMVDTGITLSAALDSIVEEEQNPSLKRILSELRNSVQEGEDFSTALARYPKYFDKTYLALVKASEATGKLGEMLDRIAAYLRKELETRSKVRAAMAYPTVMLVLAIGVTIFLLTFVLPKFTPLFERKGIDLPKPTIVMMTVSRVMIDYWPFWVAGAAALVAGFLIGKRTEPGRQLWDQIKLNLPILGPMFRKVVISRSIRTLGTMVASGVSMLEAIKLSAEVAGNYHYEQIWLKVLEEITSGNQIHTVLHGSPLFPPVLVQMIRSGEETGKLDVVLERVSNYYDQEVETSLKTATSLIEPIMIAVMGVVVGGIGMALLLPIFSLSRAPG